VCSRHAPTYRSRTFITVVVGSIVGILGVTGWHGFLYHLATQLLVSSSGAAAHAEQAPS
jgi:hypothetical protein